MHESLADTFAAVLDDDWTLGEDLFDDGRMTRSMSNPDDGHRPASLGDRPMPAHIDHYVQTASAHVNAGIPSHAAYLIGEAIGRAPLAKLYVRALRDLHSPLGFHAFAGATLRAASNDVERQAVRDAWTAVGIDAERMAVTYP
jgi:Zn-dependent metalloprotease